MRYKCTQLLIKLPFPNSTDKKTVFCKMNIHQTESSKNLDFFLSLCYNKKEVAQSIDGRRLTYEYPTCKICR